MDGQINNSIVVTSLYTNIAVCFLIFLAGAFILARILWFCRQNRKWPPQLVSFGLFWFFSGLTWLFSAISIYINIFSSSATFNRTFEILSFHAVIFFGLAITFYIFYKNFGRRMAWPATIFVAILGVIYSYYQFSSVWEKYINSDWGVSVIPPSPVLAMSLIMGGIFGLIALADFAVRIYRYSKDKKQENAVEFFIDLAIVAYFISSVFDVTGNPGWRMVLDRTFILISILAAYIILSETGYMKMSLKKLN